MKIQRSCDEHQTSITVAFADVQDGTVFSFSMAGNEHSVLFLRTVHGAVRLKDNYHFDGLLFHMLSNYKEYPNARIVLE